jgi:hypothetical protein
MIGFIGTSLQLQSIITVHTSNSFLTTSDECSVKNPWLPYEEILWRISRDWNLLDWTNFHADRIQITKSNGSLVLLLLFVSCYEM